MDITDGSEGGEITVSAEGSFGQDSVLQNLVCEQHIGQLSPYLLRHHFNSPRIRHTSNTTQPPPACATTVSTSLERREHEIDGRGRHN